MEISMMRILLPRFLDNQPRRLVEMLQAEAVEMGSRIEMKAVHRIGNRDFGFNQKHEQMFCLLLKYPFGGRGAELLAELLVEILSSHPDKSGQIGHAAIAQLGVFFQHLVAKTCRTSDQGGQKHDKVLPWTKMTQQQEKLAMLQAVEVVAIDLRYLKIMQLFQKKNDLFGHDYRLERVGDLFGIR